MVLQAARLRERPYSERCAARGSGRNLPITVTGRQNLTANSHSRYTTARCLLRRFLIRTGWGGRDRLLRLYWNPMGIARLLIPALLPFFRRFDDSWSRAALTSRI